jgi:hypothetical protein
MPSVATSLARVLDFCSCMVFRLLPNVNARPAKIMAASEMEMTISIKVKPSSRAARGRTPRMRRSRGVIDPRYLRGLNGSRVVFGAGPLGAGGTAALATGAAAPVAVAPAAGVAGVLDELLL